MLYDKLNYNFVRDIAPVATLIRQHLVMVVHPSFPGKTVPEFIAHAKANPGKVNMASAGSGTPPHLFGALAHICSSGVLFTNPSTPSTCGHASLSCRRAAPPSCLASRAPFRSTQIAVPDVRDTIRRGSFTVRLLPRTGNIRSMAN